MAGYELSGRLGNQDVATGLLKNNWLSSDGGLSNNTWKAPEVSLGIGESAGLPTGQMLDGASSNMDFSSMSDWLFGKTNTNTGMQSLGAANTIIGAIGGITNLLNAQKSYELSKQALAQNKKQFDFNKQGAMKSFNAKIDDTERSRNASREGASTNPYQSLSQYRLV